MGKKSILDVRVKDVEKRRYPTKHYVYILEVNWSEGSFTTIYRRYSDFFEFQCFLLEKFPLEGGSRDPTQRMIPFLPGKKLFGRSHTRAVAEKRREKIDEYCRTLIRLPPNISDCEFVLEFFEVRQTDLEKPQKPKTMKGQPKISEISDPLILERYVAIADYEKQKKNECTVQAGQTVEVIDKNENGWWFVNVDDFHEGWVPATYLDPLYGSEDIAIRKLDPGEEETWISVNPYEAKHHDELSFEKGVLLEVFEKGIDGWWRVRYKGKEGMAPAAYLQRYQGQGAGMASTGAEIVSTVKDATDLTLSTNTSTKQNSYTNKPLKSPTFARSTTMTSPPPQSNSTTMTSPPPQSNSDSRSLSMTLNISYNESTPITPALTTSLASSKKASAVASLAGVMEGKIASSSSSASQPAPTPSPKPVASPAVAAAAAAEKQKFAPTWHSSAHTPVVDKEPIYGPTPRRYSFKKPPLQKREVSSSSSAFPEPVYEIIPEPEAEIYMTIAEFHATAGDGVSFEAGRECTVVTKNPAGWWYVDMEGQEGWVPSSYLERKPSSPAPTPAPSTTSPPPPPVAPKAAKKEQSKDLVRELPKKKELAKKDPAREMVRKEISRERKEVASKTEPKKETAVRETPKKQEPIARRDPKKKMELKNDTSPLGVRKFSLASRSTNLVNAEQEQERPTLRRSTSTDSGLYEELQAVKKKESNPLHSPPPVRVTQAPPRPKRPKNTPTLPNPKSISSSKSPKADRHTLKATISGPLPYQPSPNSRRKSEATTQSAFKSSTLHSPSSETTKLTKVPTAGLHAKPVVRRGGSDEMLNSLPSTRDSGARHVKKNSSPDMTLDSLSNGPSTSRRMAEPPTRPNPHTRRGSADNTTGNAYKTELAKKLATKTAVLSSSQQPKRPSPPNRPKAPPTRPQPSKVEPGKRPPPPRPSTSPAMPKKSVFVTIGNYSGGDAASCLTFSDGEDVDVIERNDDGWWFVKIGKKEGWAPSTYIEEKQSTGRSCPPRPKPPPPFSTNITQKRELDEPDTCDPTPKPKPRPVPRGRKTTTCFYRAIDSYEVPAYEDSGLSLTQGRLYELKEKREGGWWLMKDGDIEGWAPSSYFKAV